jgi:hypothetical protein
MQLGSTLASWRSARLAHVHTPENAATRVEMVSRAQLWSNLWSNDETREAIARLAFYFPHHSVGFDGTLGGTRTPSLLVRSQTLYPLSYEGRASAALAR